MNIDRYKILKPQNPGFFKDKGSRFISYAFNIKNEIEVSGCINLIKKKEKNAQWNKFFKKPFRESKKII